MWGQTGHSLLGQLRFLIGFGLCISVIALAVKSYYLNQTEERALDLMMRTAPVIEATQHVPELITALRQLARSIPATEDPDVLSMLEHRLGKLRSDADDLNLLRDSALADRLRDSLVLQREISVVIASLIDRLHTETRRLDALSWQLDTEQSRLSLELSRAVDSQNVELRGPALVLDLAAISKIASAVGALRLAAHDIGGRPSTATGELKPLILKEIEGIATQLARMPHSQIRDSLAAAFRDHKTTMLGEKGVFEDVASLRLLLDQQDDLMATIERYLTKLSSQAEQATHKTVDAFRATAIENRATTRAMRRIDLLVTAVGWIGLSAYLWFLIERNLFARIEHLVGHVRAIADGGFDHPIRVRGHDEIGELEHATERSRQTTRAKLNTLFENAPSGIITVNADGSIQRANLAIRDMFGVDPDALEGERIETLIPDIMPQMGALPAVSRQASTGRVDSSCDRELCAHRRDGTQFAVDVAIGRIDVEGETSFVAIVRDVNERKAAEAELRAAYSEVQRQREELERSNHDLDNFAYAASHDLKAPLRAIRNVSGWIEEDLEGKAGPETATHFGLMRMRMQRMEKLLDDLLAYSRIGRIEERSELVSGDDLVREVIGLCELPPGFEVTVDDGLALLSVKNMPLKNILLNLVTNAIKHHDKQIGKIHIAAGPQGDGLVFEVADDGPGIPPEFHERVLRMFETLKPRDQVEGSGMGLAMVKREIDIRAGTLEIESDGHRGTVFRFSWPGEGGADAVRRAS